MKLIKWNFEKLKITLGKEAAVAQSSRGNITSVFVLVCFSLFSLLTTETIKSVLSSFTVRTI